MKPKRMNYGKLHKHPGQSFPRNSRKEVNLAKALCTCVKIMDLDETLCIKYTLPPDP